MDKTDSETLKIITRFMREAKKSLDVKRVILFGSRASGQSSTWSDIDIAVISNDFNGMDFIKRSARLGKIAWVAKTTEVEAFGFTEQEYERAGRLDFAWEIKKTGKVVA